MLKVSSNIGTNVYWWGKFDTRTQAYYSQKTRKPPNSIYYYDSIGSFLLGNIIKKLTGKDFLEYLKEKVLLELGFSKDSYVLTEPGGYAVGDSGVMCTLKDFLIFARLIAKHGKVGDKQYIDEKFMKDAISVQAQNDLYTDFRNYRTYGYGYLIWIIDGGFAFSGAGDQFLYYNAEKDLTFAIHSDNQGTTSSQHIIYHMFSRFLLPKVSDKSLEENPSSYKKLLAYEKNTKLIAQRGETKSDIIDKINGVTYKTVIPSSMNITEFKYEFFDTYGRLTFIREGETNSLEFGLGENKFIDFSFGKRPKEDMMGVDVIGTYYCASSAGFIDDKVLAIKVQVIDTYFGKVQITGHFNNDEATLYFLAQGQYVFDDIGGYVVAKVKQGE
jgi:hypothetical protein